MRTQRPSELKLNIQVKGISRQRDLKGHGAEKLKVRLKSQVSALWMWKTLRTLLIRQSACAKKQRRLRLRRLPVKRWCGSSALQSELC